MPRKSAGLGLGLNPEIKEVESSENSNNESDGEALENKDENNLTPQKLNAWRSPEKSERRSDKHGSTSRKMQELKQNWKAGHVLANVLFLLLRDLDYERLQQYGSLVNMIYITLSTEMSQRFRYKERAKVY